LSLKNDFDLTSLFTFSGIKEKKEIEKIYREDINAQQYKKKILQKSYEQIERLYKERYEVDETFIKIFQLSQYAIHDELRLLNYNLFSCCEYGITKTCECGQVVQSPMFCRETKLCPICNNVESMRRMQNIFRTFTLLDTSLTNESDFYFIHNVLTYPKDYFDSDLSKEDIFREMYNHANEWKKKVYGKHVSAIVVCHSWKTEDPLSPDNHFHVHMIIPEFVFSPIVEKSLVPLKKIHIELKESSNYYKIKESYQKSRRIVDYSKMKKILVYRDVKILRQVWKKTINYDSEVNIFHQYTNSKKKLAHLIKYIVRGFIQDVNNYLLKNENKSILLTEKNKERIFYHANFELAFNRVRWFGFLCNSQRGTFVNWFIPSILWKKILEFDKSFEVCPRCFKVIDFWDGMTKKYDSKNMLRTIRMNLLVYKLYELNCHSRLEIRKG